MSAHTWARPGRYLFQRRHSWGRAGGTQRAPQRSQPPRDRARPRPPWASCRSSGFFADAVRSARCDSHAPRLTAGALRVLSLDAVVGIFCACGAHKTPSFIIPVRSPLEATRDAGLRGGRKTRRGARKPDGARAPSGFVQKFWRHPREAGCAYGGTPPVNPVGIAKERG